MRRREDAFTISCLQQTTGQGVDVIRDKSQVVQRTARRAIRGRFGQSEVRVVGSDMRPRSVVGNATSANLEVGKGRRQEANGGVNARDRQVRVFQNNQHGDSSDIIGRREAAHERICTAVRQFSSLLQRILPGTCQISP